MNIEMLDVNKVFPYAKNARKIPQSAIDKVATSITEFGFRQPICTDEKHVIIAGHTRLLAAKQLGLTHVPVHVAEGLTKAQVKAYRLADNRTSEESRWNKKLLATEFEDLKELGFDLGLTGFDTDEIEGNKSLKQITFMAKDNDDDAIICPECNHEFTP